MNESNIKFASNIYVLTGESKLADRKFMSQVVDPGAISEIAKKLPKDGKNNPMFTSELHATIYAFSTPCAYGNGDYTHGVIKEDGRLICVNTCENNLCPYFSRCRSSVNYRKIDRTKQPTTNFLTEEENTDTVLFDIELPARPKNYRVQKLTLAKIPRRHIVEEIKYGIRSYDAKRWEVRGFWRRLSDGTQTWVRPHNRHHDEEEVQVSYFVKKFKQKKYKFKYSEQLNKFKKIVAEAERREKERHKPEAAISQSNNTYQLKKIEQVKSAEIIIESALSSKILVNAGPGTGKTHTVIERLKYIIDHEEDIDPESVLVLCFSRSAVKVIRDRLAEAIDSGEISAYAKLFTVSTFDSFATWYLMQVNPKRNLAFNSYDDRIKMFIDEYKGNSRLLNESLSYLIVDEVQDLVGIRARLVQTLLQNISCGFLLLGDECQAIYDFQITGENDLNASKLYEWLEKSFAGNLEEYELTHDWRHNITLEKELKPLRNAMLWRAFDIQKDELNKLLRKHENFYSSVDAFCSSEGKRAILSWSNGDAYRQSQDLYLNNCPIKHTILTGSKKISFRKEISLILSDYVRREIDKSTFIKLAAEVGVERESAKQLWEGILFTAVKENDGNIVLEDLRRALISERRIDESLVSADEADVVISTIHKAKGKEFDSVFLNQSGDIKQCEDIKVHYVALTRARNELSVKRNYSRHRDIQTEQGRYIEIFGRKLKRIELGIDGDIDPLGFVNKNLPGMDPVKRQHYILENVHVGDSIKVSKYRGNYLISHKGHFIGCLNRYALYDSYRHYYPSGKTYTYRFNEYTDFVDLYVKDVVTIVNNTINSDIAEPYNKSGFWLGIEFCGYAKPLEE